MLFRSEAVAACKNLIDLVIVHGAEVVAFPQYHPTLERVCILPTIDVQVDVPKKIFSNAIMNPLDDILQSVERMVVPQIQEIRVRNTGAFVGITRQRTWLMRWWRRWNIRGIRFVDQFGIPYNKAEIRMLYYFASRSLADSFHSN